MQTEVILSLRTKLADATETVNTTARLRKQAHDLEIDVATLMDRACVLRQKSTSSNTKT